jgi:hypothetical protein
VEVEQARTGDLALTCGPGECVSHAVMGMASIRLVGSMGLAALSLLVSSTVAAQSSADKATARELAQEGIKAAKAGDCKLALDRLQKAQSLYDAPVHLINIARCQVKLGRLVDASESYRKLVRSDLPAGSPAAFKEAVDLAQPELDQLLPLIPKLTISVKPEGLEGVEVAVDGQAVSTVVLGMARPADPGEHEVTARARGYRSVSRKVALKERGTGSVELVLEVDPTAAVAGTPATVGATSSSDASSGGTGQSGSNPTGEGTAKVKPFGWGSHRMGLNLLGGVRLVGSVPGGAARKVNGSEAALSDLLKPGGGLELQLGVNFKELFTGWLFAQPQWYAGNTVYYDANKRTADWQVDMSTMTTAAEAGQVGLGFSIGSAPGEWGGYGEIGIGIEQLSIKSDIVANLGGVDGACSVEETYSGKFLRFGGGGTLPVTRWLQLNPFALIALGTYDDYTADTSCQGVTSGGASEVLAAMGGGAISSSDQVVHTFFQLGIGGQVMLGL